MKRVVLSARRHLPAILAIGAIGAVGAIGAAQEPVALTWTKPDQFWFQRTVPGGHVWLNVDAAHGVKEPLFDHQRLAIELAIRTGVEYGPLALPFSDPAAEFVVKYDGSNAYIQEGAMAIEFLLDGRHWRCDLQVKWDWNKVPPTDYECLNRGPAAPGQRLRAPAGASRVSPDGKWEALVQDHNVAIRFRGAGASARPLVLSKDGTADDAYAFGSLQWSADSKTVSAYRVHADVWRAESVTGSVKDKVASGAWTVPATRERPRVR
jgi:hypothetical protein